MKKNSQLISSLRKVGRIKTFGNSMLPLLRDGDVVYFRPVSFQHLVVDDIVTIHKSGSLFTHRLIYKGNNYLITKGDANFHADGKFHEKDIVGKVIQITRGSISFNPSYYYLIQSTLYFNELSKIFNKFNNAGINYVVLKGLPLYLYLTDNHPRRVYADCDILVDKKTAHGVYKLLQSLDFMAEDIEKYKSVNKFIDLDFKEVTFYKKIEGLAVVIDLHFEATFATHKVKLYYSNLQRAIDNFSRNILNNKKYATVYGHKVSILSVNDQVLYLLLHLYNHNWQGVHRFEFIKNYIDRNQKDIDWKDIFDYAGRLGFVNFISPGILFLNLLYKGNFSIQPALKQAKDHMGIVMKLMINTYLKNLNVHNETNSINLDRFRRAFLTVILFQDKFIPKLLYVLRPSLVIHLMFFLGGSIKSKYFRRNS